MIDPSILDGLQQGIIDPKTLTAETLAAIATSLADATGQPIPAKYKYTLRMRSETSVSSDVAKFKRKP